MLSSLLDLSQPVTEASSPGQLFAGLPQESPRRDYSAGVESSYWAVAMTIIGSSCSSLL